VVWPRWPDDRILKFWETVAWTDKIPTLTQGGADTGTVFVTVEIPRGSTVTVPFYLTWHFPNFQHWQSPSSGPAPIWQNWYATQWPDAWAVAQHVDQHFERLHCQTTAFHDALFASTLPTHVLDAVSSQLSILKSPTCLRLTDGTFYGFEGCSDTGGCCEGTCTHVWNYAQALPYLFPSLQRSVREAEWTHSMQDDGFVCFRMPLPLGTKGGTGFHPAADGQMGTIMQVYREWLISGDDEWLRKIWPLARRALAFAWHYWDADRDGVMEGMQHNTYDMEFYGPNTMMGSLYLGALRAAEELARRLGEEEEAAEYRELFERGSKWTDGKLFNGEYYEQIVNPTAHEAWPDNLRHLAEQHGKDDVFPNWPRWQFGTGCLSDQLLGQWYAEMLGLGYLYDRKKVRQALQSIFRYNWRPDLSGHPCTLRVYAQNEEAGLVIASWPRGERPGFAFWFADEVWCGIEYQVASHLIYEGFVEEGLAIVKGIRDRHTGERRNPWDEFECGHHYARSLASYSLLLALSGFAYSAPAQSLGFAPRVNRRNFRVFFSVESGWGTFAQRLEKRRAQYCVTIRQGSLPLKTLRVRGAPRRSETATAVVGKQRVPVTLERDGPTAVVSFEEPLVLKSGETLRVRVEK
jgi:uncharacterized protein (DUF608 family)